MMHTTRGTSAILLHREVASPCPDFKAFVLPQPLTKDKRLRTHQPLILVTRVVLCLHFLSWLVNTINPLN